jgi:hypothetical protein
VAVPTPADVTRYRWSSDEHADRFSVENPATLAHFGYRKLIRFLWHRTRPQWRAVGEIFG